MTRRIARQGYFAILPDMYYRLGSLRFDIPRRDDKMATVFLGAMNSLTNAMVMDDTAGLLGFLDAQDKCKPGPVGCVGYCMSGQHITNACFVLPAPDQGGSLALRGRRSSPTRRISPHRFHFDKIKGELYYAFAETDRSVPPNIPGDLAPPPWQRANIKHEIKTFPGTEHGFAFPERAVYSTLAAEETWDRTNVRRCWDRNLEEGLTVHSPAGPVAMGGRLAHVRGIRTARSCRQRRCYWRPPAQWPMPAIRPR